jgi:serine/threonine protein kinase
MSSKFPSEKELQTAFAELRAKGFHHIVKIGKGAYGCVCKAFRGASNQLIAIKISRNQKLTQVRASKIHAAFQRTLQRLGSNYRQYFTEDRFEKSTTTSLLFQYMEYLEGMDMQQFMQAHADKVTMHDLLRILCHTLNAMYFFHEARVMLNDLKIENVFINPKTLEVTMIDYTDCALDCDETKCKFTTSSIIRTYENEFDSHITTKEDVWRLGLLWLDILTMIINANTPVYDSLWDGSEDVVDALENAASMDRGYPTDEINKIVDDRIDPLQTFWDPDVVNLQTKLRSILYAMLAPSDKRPSINVVRKNALFRSACPKKFPMNARKQSYKTTVCNPQLMTMTRRRKSRQKSAGAPHAVTRRISRRNSVHLRRKSSGGSHPSRLGGRRLKGGTQ